MKVTGSHKKDKSVTAGPLDAYFSRSPYQPSERKSPPPSGKRTRSEASREKSPPAKKTKRVSPRRVSPPKFSNEKAELKKAEFQDEDIEMPESPQIIIPAPTTTLDSAHYHHYRSSLAQHDSWLSHLDQLLTATLYVPEPVAPASTAPIQQTPAKKKRTRTPTSAKYKVRTKTHQTRSASKTNPKNEEDNDKQEEPVADVTPPPPRIVKRRKKVDSSLLLDLTSVNSHSSSPPKLTEPTEIPIETEIETDLDSRDGSPRTSPQKSKGRSGSRSRSVGSRGRGRGGSRLGTSRPATVKASVDLRVLCHECGSYFPDELELKRHQNKQTHQKRAQKISVVAEESKKKFSCSYPGCEAGSFETERLLRNHKSKPGHFHIEARARLGTSDPKYLPRKKPQQRRRSI